MWRRVAIAVTLGACAGCGRIGFDARNDGARADLPGPVGNRAFVTSSVQAAASLGGLARADEICMTRAGEAGLPGRFVAFLSLETAPARDRLLGARGWYRMDGQPIADTLDDLVGFRVLLPITLDERGGDHSQDDTFVTTGTYLGNPNSTCSDYTDGTDSASAGKTYYASGGWMNSDIVSCSVPTRLYCFQIDHDLPVTYTRATGRAAFVSTAGFVPSSGIAAADSICTTEAQAAGLLGSYRAMLPDLASPAQRFTAAGPPWVRTDGIALAPTADDVLLGKTRAPLCVRADGTFDANYVITGSLPVSYDPTRDCGAWSDPGGGNQYGHAVGIGNTTFAQTTTDDCVTPLPVYCFQQ